MAAARRGQSKVFFPWERRQGVFGVLGRARWRLVVPFVMAVLLVIWIHEREEKAAAVRSTRATLATTYRAMWAYRADHDKQCPRELGELVTGGYMQDLPVDAWGRMLRLTCPGRRDPAGFELTSDGPDGLPFGLDRVE